MTRTSFALAAIAAFALGAPASAQEAAASSDCVAGAKPVVSEGLPTRPCAANSGVVVNRGPEVAPEPSAVAPEPEPEPTTTIRRVIRRSPFATTYRSSSYAVPYYYPVAPRTRSGPSFGVVIQTDDVYLRFGDAYPRPVRPRYPHWPNPHDWDWKAEPDAPQIGVLRSRR